MHTSGQRTTFLDKMLFMLTLTYQSLNHSNLKIKKVKFKSPICPVIYSTKSPWADFTLQIGLLRKTINKLIAW